ncbi:protein phosphatase 1 regulatory subunit 3A [Nothobranchius furzeri]|nr:protein phosphatase 1 regulatory subunit 3A [Nothobranchius furzeri]
MSAARSRSSTVPPLTLTESFMEFVGRRRPSEACSLLAVPNVSFLDVDEDDGAVIIRIRPKSSPIPSRKSSFTDEDSEPEPSLSCSRRVSFADAKGLSLVQVKKFDAWDSPNPPTYDSTSTDGPEIQEFFLLPLTFSLPVPDNELVARVQEQKIELETIELLPGTTILKGVIRVLNISYDKSVYVRTTLDDWCTHFDLLAEYIPSSSDGVMDGFLFKLTLAPPFRDQRARVDFCLRYETPMGTFWANNNNKNYVVVCQKDKGQRDNVNKKSCLKTVSQTVSTVENIASKPVSSQENKSTDECVGGSAEDLRDLKISEGRSETLGDEEQKLL